MTLGHMLNQPSHNLATSALPDAPVVDEPERVPRGTPRTALATALRATACAIRRLADRVEPAGSRYSAA
ncbi:MAG: hypothetical protein L0H84_20895 [Pseudonocardia sp.]|nr:hypothetical protein [Pseudonocardia sp.]